VSSLHLITHLDYYKEYLSAAGVTPCNNCINLTYDTTGYYYEIPNYCINEPYRYDITNHKNSLPIPKQIEIEIIIRKFIRDKSYKVKNRLTVSQLKKLIAKNFEEIDINLIRLFFGGKELKDNDELWSYNVGEGSIIQMM
jgi:hypothetical protein